MGWGMKARHYADKSDLGKWSALLHLAYKYDLKVVVQVAFLNPKKENLVLLKDGEEVDCNSPRIVWNFFRNPEAITRLAKKPRVVFLGCPFDHSERKAYLDCVIARLKAIGKEPKAVLLDPDTGIAPDGQKNKPGPAHVSLAEIGEVWSKALRPSDWLVVYQHQHRNDGNDWDDKDFGRLKDELARQHRSPSLVHKFQCKLPPDPAFRNCVLLAAHR